MSQYAHRKDGARPLAPAPAHTPARAPAPALDQTAAAALASQAHQHEEQARSLLGLELALITSFAPPAFQGSSTRAGFVLGLRGLVKALDAGPLPHPPDHLTVVADGGLPATDRVPREVLLRVHRHLEAADDCYWKMAQGAKDLVERRRPLLGTTAEDADQEGLLWLFKAAQRYDPSLGPWRRYAISWLTAASVRRRDDHFGGVLAGRARNLRRRALALMADARQRGTTLTEQEVAAELGASVELLRSALAASVLRSIDEPSGSVGGHSWQGGQQDGLLRNQLVGVAGDMNDAGADARRDVEGLLARVLPQEAWLIARRAGLWDTAPATLQSLAREVNASKDRIRGMHQMALDRLGEVLAVRRRPANDGANSTDVSPLRWAVQLQAGVPLEDVAERAGVAPMSVLASAVHAAGAAGVQLAACPWAPTPWAEVAK